MATRGKRFALVAAVLALAVMVAAVVANWRWLVEEYHIRRLASDDVNVRQRAALALGEMKSVRAVPYLLRVVAEAYAASPRRRATRPKLNSDDATERLKYSAPIAILKIGHDALPELR